MPSASATSSQVNESPHAPRRMPAVVEIVAARGTWWVETQVSSCIRPSFDNIVIIGVEPLVLRRLVGRGQRAQDHETPEAPRRRHLPGWMENLMSLASVLLR